MSIYLPNLRLFKNVIDRMKTLSNYVVSLLLMAGEGGYYLVCSQMSSLGFVLFVP